MTTTRVTDCAGETMVGTLVNTQGEVVGNATVEVIYWGPLSTKSLTWTMGAKAYIEELDGVAAVDSTLNGSAACSVTGNTTTAVPLVQGEFMAGQWTITSSTPGTVRVTSTQALRLAFDSPPPTVPGAGNSVPLSTVRCDNSATIGKISPSCVYPDVTPVFLLSRISCPRVPAARRVRRLRLVRRSLNAVCQG